MKDAESFLPPCFKGVSSLSILTYPLLLPKVTGALDKYLMSALKAALAHEWSNTICLSLASVAPSTGILPKPEYAHIQL